MGYEHTFWSNPNEMNKTVSLVARVEAIVRWDIKRTLG